MEFFFFWSIGRLVYIVFHHHDRFGTHFLKLRKHFRKYVLFKNCYCFFSAFCTTIDPFPTF